MKNKNAKRSRSAALLVCLLLAVAAVFSGYSIAKYINTHETDTLFVAKNFYFESDLLADSSQTMPHHTLMAGVDDISFDVMNYPDNLRTSEVDISYSVNIKGDDINEKRINLTLVKNAKSRETVVFDNLDAGTYEVEAVAETPYSKTLHAKFTIVPLATGFVPDISDGIGSPVLLVKIETTDFAGKLAITIPTGVYPDNTDPLMTNASGSVCIVDVEKNSEYTFRFFKADPDQDYKSVITVEKYTP